MSVKLTASSLAPIGIPRSTFYDWYSRYQEGGIEALVDVNQPGGNITGVTFLSTVTEAIRLQMLHEAVPGAAIVGLLVNPSNPNSEPDTREVQEAALKLGLDLHVVSASNPREIDAAFAYLTQKRDYFASTSGVSLNRLERKISIRGNEIAERAFDNSILRQVPRPCFVLTAPCLFNGVCVNESQIEGPRPSALTAPSI